MNFNSGEQNKLSSHRIADIILLLRSLINSLKIVHFLKYAQTNMELCILEFWSQKMGISTYYTKYFTFIFQRLFYLKKTLL